jgi:uncharacterized protein
LFQRKLLIMPERKPRNRPNNQSHVKRNRKKQRQRTLGALLFFGFTLISGGLGFLVTAWYFADYILRVKHEGETYDLRVKGVTSETVTVERTSNTERRGLHGLDWSGGSAIVGEIIASDAKSVTRRLIQASSRLQADQRVHWNVHTYDGNPERGRGLSYTDVQVPGALGQFPAWYIPGKVSTWVIMVHGYKSSRAEGLRIMPLFVRLGLPVLDITYRNDIEAPASPDKLYHLGSTEWQDLEAAVQYALAHGAEDIVLYGWSMGGNIVETFLRRSSYVSYVQAVVLDAPVLNWRLVFDKQARDRHFPEVITSIVEQIMRLRAGIDFNAQDHVAFARLQPVPTLLFHGVDDSLIPVAGSDAFAQACPDLVTYQRVSGANHTQEWNVDAQVYEDALETFLLQTLRLEPEQASEEVQEVSLLEKKPGAKK